MLSLLINVSKASRLESSGRSAYRPTAGDHPRMDRSLCCERLSTTVAGRGRLAPRSRIMKMIECPDGLVDPALDGTTMPAAARRTHQAHRRQGECVTMTTRAFAV